MFKAVGLLSVAGLSAGLISGCSSMPAPVGAARTPAVVSSDHYTGTWLEIGRRPMAITNGCVAGFTTYAPGRTAGEVSVVDGCHQGTPNGKLKTIAAKGELLDVGTTHAKLRVHYPFFITFDYWVLYEAPDHSWFISADPAMRNLWIYARQKPTDDLKTVMVTKASALGYDTTQLEFPAQ